MVLTAPLILTHGIVLLLARTHGIDMDSWYRQGLMLMTWTHGIDNTHGIDLDSSEMPKVWNLQFPPPQ